MADSGRPEKLAPSTVLRIRAVGAGVLLVCLGFLYFGSTAEYVGRIRDASFDIYQRISPREISDKFPALVIEIDQASLVKYGPWPWPRSRIAELTQALFDYGALVVGFDIVFSEPDRFGAENLTAMYPGLPAESKQALREHATPDETFRELMSGAGVYIVVGRAGVEKPGDGSKRAPFHISDRCGIQGRSPQRAAFIPDRSLNTSRMWMSWPWGMV